MDTTRRQILQALGVTGTAASASNSVITTVTWTSNRGPSGTATGTASWQADVPLFAGVNVITVTAVNGSGSVGNASVTITVENLKYLLAEGATGAFFDLEIFAEGSQGYFDTYLLLANPQPAANVATVVFLPESGTPVTKTFDLEPTSRRTVYAGLISELVNSSFGIDVAFTQPGVARPRIRRTSCLPIQAARLRM